MDVQQKLDVRKAFKLRIHESNGNAFEDLFCDVMRASNKNFKKVSINFKINIIKFNFLSFKQIK